jgi:hypothetical protein
MRYADLILLSYRTVISHKLRSALTAFSLVPKLQLGNPVDEAPASRDWKLEPFDKAQDRLPQPSSQAGAWELAISVVVLAKR